MRILKHPIHHKSPSGRSCRGHVNELMFDRLRAPNRSRFHKKTLNLIQPSSCHSTGVGKTSLVAKYMANVYSKEIGPTIGASFFTCKINLNDTKVKMQLWDTAGQERFKAMAPMYYRNANAALLVFDVTNHTSFEEVKSWILELQRNVQEPMFLLLVGNKIDLEEQRAVSREEAVIYSQSIGAKFIESSVFFDQVGPARRRPSVSI